VWRQKRQVLALLRSVGFESDVRVGFSIRIVRSNRNGLSRLMGLGFRHGGLFDSESVSFVEG
jgi:hypothetical protein